MDDYEPGTKRDFRTYAIWFLRTCVGIIAFGLIWRAVVPPEPREQPKYSVGGEISRQKRFSERLQAETYDGLESHTERLIVTAYCAGKCCCSPYDDGITASGHIIQPGDRFAAAPADIPFGTIIDIPGYGRVPVLDRGGKIGCGRLDVFFGENDGGHNAALEWGRQILTVKFER